jgi:Flp pilus assembly pilin Flp
MIRALPLLFKAGLLHIKTYYKDKTAATALEYAIMASLLVAVTVALIFTIGEQTQSLFQSFVDEF